MAIPRLSGCIGACALGLLAVGCNGASPSTLDRYCGVVQQNLVAINSHAIASPADITISIKLYQTIADQAPLAVAPEWRTMVATLQAAANVVPGDAASVEAATDAALTGQPAYTRIQQYTKASCGTDIGSPPPMTSPANPQANTSAPTTT
ncbi:MAG: hypothetical protein RLZZ623_2658 [Actinomycetota bacterium]